jgi:hypothetical protein
VDAQRRHALRELGFFVGADRECVHARSLSDVAASGNPTVQSASVSQGGLGFWLEQAINFLPGDRPVF